MSKLLPEFEEFLKIMIKHKVNFMLIGGYAVIFYGYGRTTKDIDIWLEPENRNKENVINALREFGISEESLERIEKLDFRNAQMFYFGEKPRRIEFLTKISGVKFKDSIGEMNYLSIEGAKIPIIDYKHLILNKMLSDRMKDKADVEELQRIAKYRKK